MFARELGNGLSDRFDTWSPHVDVWTGDAPCSSPMDSVQWKEGFLFFPFLRVWSCCYPRCGDLLWVCWHGNITGICLPSWARCCLNSNSPHMCKWPAMDLTPRSVSYLCVCVFHECINVATCGNLEARRPLSKASCSWQQHISLVWWPTVAQWLFYSGQEKTPSSVFQVGPTVHLTYLTRSIHPSFKGSIGTGSEKLLPLLLFL